MARRIQRSNRTASWTWRTTVYGEEIEVDCEVEYDVVPGERAIMYGDNACAGSDPEVQVITVRVESTGEDVTESVDLDDVAADLLDTVVESERDRLEAMREDAAEARAEARRDR